MELSGYTPHPKLDPLTEQGVEACLKPLLSLCIPDAADILSYAFGLWSTRLVGAEEIDRLAEENPAWTERYPYSPYLQSRKRRSFLRDVYADGLLYTEPGPSVSRIEIVHCRQITPGELEQKTQELVSWLSGLEAGQALKAIIELTLRWTERASMQETRAFAQMLGVSSLTGEEQVAGFLGNMLHEILLKMDLGAPGQGHPWADPAEWYPPLQPAWDNVPAQSEQSKSNKRSSSSEEIETYLLPLLSACIPEAVQIMVKAFHSWVSSRLEMEDIDRLAEQYNDWTNRLNYDQYKRSRTRRKYMRDWLDELVSRTGPSGTFVLAEAGDCQKLAPAEVDTRAVQISSWLGELEDRAAFECMVALIVYWAYRYNPDVARSFAEEKQYEVTGIPELLLWVFHDALLLDNQILNQKGGPWTDPAAWYLPPVHPAKTEKSEPSKVYPFSDLLPQLQILCTPGQYKRIVGPQYQTRGYIPYENQAYWQIVPKYLFARCPICEYVYQQPADTYNLRVWGGWNRLLDALYGQADRLPERNICSHFLGIAQFCNLHGWVPEELNWFDQKTGEVPYVTAGLLPDQIASFVVLHALPICHIEKDPRSGADQFVPRYTVFNLTYFAWDPKEVLRLNDTRQTNWAGNDPEFMPATLDPVGTKPNLEEWARKGKLGWLDTSFPALPLRIGKGLELPERYRNIAGKTRTYHWKRSDKKHANE